MCLWGGISVRLGGFIKKRAGDVAGAVAEKENGIGDNFLRVSLRDEDLSTISIWASAMA